MAGHPRVVSSSEQLCALQELARSERRDEADRARAIVLSVNGWTSGQIARAFGVTPDSVRRWRSWFAADGVEGLRAGERTGREAVKSEAAAAVVEDLLAAPVADRANWTLPRLQAEITRQTAVSISKSQLSKALKKTATDGAGPGTACATDKMPMPSIAPDSGSDC
jgi:transposase